MPEMKDCRGLTVTMSGPDALAAHEELTNAYLGFKVNTGDCLKKALSVDAEAPMHQAMAGYIFLLMALKPMVSRANAASEKATELAEQRGNAREKLHATALAKWCAGDITGAADRLEALLIEWPKDILAIKLAHYLHFYKGDVVEHRDSLARVMPAWSLGMPGYSAVLGMRAFGLEEAGHYEEAERIGRRAVDLDPEDTWAIHSVAHVLEMQGRHQEGIEWIDRNADEWDGKIHSFANHVWWHKALYHLELGQYEEVLSLYDKRFYSELSDDGLDIANASSMLMRLRLHGIDVSDRFEHLADVIIKNKLEEALLPFNDLHYSLALAGAGKPEAKLLSERICKEDRKTHWGAVYRDVGAPLSQGLVAYGNGDFRGAIEALNPIRYSWSRIGGSHAQRDIFQQVLIDAAMKAEDWALANSLLAERTALRPNSHETHRRAKQVASAL